MISLTLALIWVGYVLIIQLKTLAYVHLGARKVEFYWYLSTIQSFGPLAIIIALVLENTNVSQAFLG